MVVTVMKTSHRKSQPKIIYYRNYKNFSNGIFRESLQKIFSQNVVNSCDKDVDDFLISCSKILDQYAPRKKEVCEVIIRLLRVKICLKLLC